MSGRIPVKPAGLVAPSGPTTRAPLEIVTLDASKTMPSVCITGPSGGGKTRALARLLASGKYSTLLLAIENKTGILGKYKPPTIFVNELVKTPAGMRRMKPAEQYSRLMQFAEELAEGQHRSTDPDKPMVILSDGLMAAGKIIHAHKKTQFGRDKAFIMWGEVFEACMDWVQMLRDAASEAASRFGFAPVGVVTTLGTTRIVNDKTGAVYNDYVLPGKATGKELAFAFECVIFAHGRKVDNNETAFVYQMKLSDEWEAKSPPTFDSEIAGVPPNGPDFAEVYDRLVDYYQNPQVAD